MLNRSAGRTKLFRAAQDFSAFQRLIAEAQQRHPIRTLAYCLMGNHWHLVVWPAAAGQLTRFFRWLSHTDAMRWQVSHRRRMVDRNKRFADTAGLAEVRGGGGRLRGGWLIQQR